MLWIKPRKNYFPIWATWQPAEFSSNIQEHCGTAGISVEILFTFAFIFVKKFAFTNFSKAATSLCHTVHLAEAFREDFSIWRETHGVIAGPTGMCPRVSTAESF